MAAMAARPDPIIDRLDRVLASGVSLSEIARSAGISQPSLHRWVAARRAAPPQRLPIAERVDAACRRWEDGSDKPGRLAPAGPEKKRRKIARGVARP